MPQDEKRKTEQELMTTLTQSLLPPLGTAMYDSVWEWVFGIVTEAEKAKSSESTSSLVPDGSNKEGDSQKDQPVRQPEEAALEQGSQKVDDVMDTSELHIVRVIKEAANGTPVGESQQTSFGQTSDHPILGESSVAPVETGSPVSKARLPSEGSSESGSPLSHDSVWSQLLQQCLYGVAMCAVRCPNYFKSLYRLSSALLALNLPQVIHISKDF